jgi:hypothetical protein
MGGFPPLKLLLYALFQKNPRPLRQVKIHAKRVSLRQVKIHSKSMDVFVCKRRVRVV